MSKAAIAFTLTSGLLAAALPAERAPLAARQSNACIPSNALTPAGVYYGNGGNSTDVPTRLRISNGGAGLSGLVGALANAFINYKTGKGEKAFKIEWIKGDTTETINFLGTGQADVGITYNKAAECQAVRDGVAAQRVYGFRDHFYLAGPKSNPAGLKEFKEGSGNEDVLTQMQKIVRTGNDGTLSPPTRFLSRYDKTELFISVGQVPWAYAYSKWYHQYPMYPIDALTAAAKLGEYTITDRGTWLSTPADVTSTLVRYNAGQDNKNQDVGGMGENAADPLLNPAFFLSSTKICDDNKQLAADFLNWTISEDGQKVVEDFRSQFSSEWLYTRTPTRTDLKIQNCTVNGV